MLLKTLILRSCIKVESGYENSVIISVIHPRADIPFFYGFRVTLKKPWHWIVNTYPFTIKYGMLLRVQSLRTRSRGSDFDKIS